MFSFQAIHNVNDVLVFTIVNVKELISMFSFQAIHNIQNIYTDHFEMSKS